MEGFFDIEEFTDRQVSSGVLTKTPGCGACKLHRRVKSPKMAVTGKGNKKVLLVTEAPDAEEDQRGVQLVGKAGQECRKQFKKCGPEFDFEKDFWKTNAVICRPTEKGKNRTPTGKEVWACRPNLLNTIKRLKPHLIIPMGGVAVEALVGHRLSESVGGIGRWRGHAIPDRDLGAWICPLFHPSYIMRHTSNDVSVVLFRQDLRRALKYAYKPLPKVTDLESCVTISTSAAKTNAYLKQLIESPPERLVIDFETTGIKPQRKGHVLFSCALSSTPSQAFSFLMETADKKLLRKVLRNNKSKKVAANLKFEQAWASTHLGYLIQNWDWDTMLTAHVLDNRRGIIGLKFQAYVQFGVADYESEVSPLLKSGPGEKKAHGSNGFNKLYYELKEGHLSSHLTKRILVYGGMDALLEHKLMLKQERKAR